MVTDTQVIYLSCRHVFLNLFPTGGIFCLCINTSKTDLSNLIAHLAYKNIVSPEHNFLSNDFILFLRS